MPSTEDPREQQELTGRLAAQKAGQTENHKNYSLELTNRETG